MSQRSKQRRWPRRIAYAAGGGFGLLVLAVVVVWWQLPALVHAGFIRGATAAGFEDAVIQVERADLTGLRATAMRLRMGGLELRMAHGAADYSLRNLIGGQVARLAIDGLAVTLDFTKPRRGWLPDAVGELLALIPSSDDPLVWPVDELTLDRCRLVLVLPGGQQEFTLSGAVTRQVDGRIGFTLRSDDSEQSLEVGGTVQTETMDVEVALHRLSFEPAFALGVAEQLGLWKMPAAIRVETHRVDLSGKATLKSGIPESYSGQLRTSRVVVVSGDLEAGLTELVADAARMADGNITANVRAIIEGRGHAQPWSVAPAALQLSLDRGAAKVALAGSAVTWGEQVSTHLAVDADVGVPSLGGKAGATVKLEVTEPLIAGIRAAPFSLNASGWLDRVTLSVSELGLAEATPVTLSDLAVDIHEPLGPSRAIDVSASFNVSDALAKFVPPEWRLVEPTLPTAGLRLRGHIDATETGVAAKAELDGGWPKLVVTAGEAMFTCVPSWNFNVALDAGVVSFTGALDAKEIESSFANFPPGVQAIRLGCEVPQASLSALAELAAGRVPKDELGARVSATVVHSETRGDAYVAVRHFGEASEWSAEVWGMLENVSGAWGGAEVTGLRAEVTVDSGRLPDARLGEWLRAPEWKPLVRSTLPQTKVDVSLTAAAVERAGVARSEWTGLWLQNLRATENRAPIEARVKFSTGVLHAGPETLEQPEINLNVLGTMDDFAIEATAQAMLEGARLAVGASPRVQLDWDALTASVAGPFALEPITLTNSDILTRWVPSQRGVAITATTAANGTLSWSSRGTWDGTANLSLANGTLNIPDQGLRVEGVQTTLAITSLREMYTEHKQPISFARLAIGKVEVTNAKARFSTDGMNRVVVDAVSARVFGGDVAVGSFTLVFPAPDVGIALEFEGVDAGELLRQVEIFKGTVTGRLRGKIPVGLLAGRPYFGEGFLELDPKVPARFSMDARGLFTTDLPNQTTKEKVVRLPYEVLEEALGDVEIDTMRLDFFRRADPGTPIRIEFSGVSDTRRARVPLHIVTRVNGSVPEALNFLFRLATW